MKDIVESLQTNKSFTLNMEEIDYDMLIEFLQDMKDKNEKFIKIRVKRGTTKGKWVGYATDKNDDKFYNLTNLSK